MFGFFPGRVGAWGVQTIHVQYMSVKYNVCEREFQLQNLDFRVTFLEESWLRQSRIAWPADYTNTTALCF